MVENGWDEHKLLVLNTLERLEGKLDKVVDVQGELAEKFVKLETEGKIAKWGFSTIIPIGVTVAMNYVGKKLGFGA